jgi:hypothetical protein
VKFFHGVPLYEIYQAQALYLEIGNKANDSLEIMCWYKDDNRQTQQRFCSPKANQRQVIMED